MARIVEHLIVRLSPKPILSVWVTHDIETNTVGLGESRADTTSPGDNLVTESSPF